MASTACPPIALQLEARLGGTNGASCCRARVMQLPGQQQLLLKHTCGGCKAWCSVHSAQQLLRGRPARPKHRVAGASWGREQRCARRRQWGQSAAAVVGAVAGQGRLRRRLCHGMRGPAAGAKHLTSAAQRSTDGVSRDALAGASGGSPLLP